MADCTLLLRLFCELGCTAEEGGGVRAPRGISAPAGVESQQQVVGSETSTCLAACNHTIDLILHLFNSRVCALCTAFGSYVCSWLAVCCVRIAHGFVRCSPGCAECLCSLWLDMPHPRCGALGRAFPPHPSAPKQLSCIDPASGAACVVAARARARRAGPAAACIACLLLFAPVLHASRCIFAKALLLLLLLKHQQMRCSLPVLKCEPNLDQ